MADDCYPPIADYGLISDMHSCALVSNAGSIDWACFPRFDSAAVFSRLLDAERGGYFAVAPRGVRSANRRYLPDTNIIEATFETDSGAATLTDFMPVHPHGRPEESSGIESRQQIIRILECTRGRVEFTLDCRPRFDYGVVVPHAALEDPHTGFAHAGGAALSLFSTAPMVEADDGFRAEGSLAAGERLCAAITHQTGFKHAAETINAEVMWERLEETARYWQEWSATCTYDGHYAGAVRRSALTLKALTYAPSGALVAAATTSLPESIGGSRNWDYRFTWIRDATLSLYALFILGYHNEARDFRNWLEWATLGRASDVQPMYGVGGERRLTEIVLPELSGYRDSTPVRIGNGAYEQSQLDVYGELLDSAHQYRRFGGEMDARYWDYLRRVVDLVIEHWRDADEGIWETRGGPQHFVLSKVMCWVALDRAIKAARALGLPGDVERWRAVRAEIKEDVLRNGYDEKCGAFVQAYGSKNLDASNLLLPLVGFVRADDPRMRSTIEATARELTSPEGFVYRYRGYDDGFMGEEEGVFLICSYWLADNFIALGEVERGRALFEKCSAFANDLGLLSEQVDAKTGQLLGNFPQAFSHLALINTAVQLHRAAEGRARGQRAGPAKATAS